VAFTKGFPQCVIKASISEESELSIIVTSFSQDGCMCPLTIKTGHESIKIAPSVPHISPYTPVL
jgi:hypothetical protein